MSGVPTITQQYMQSNLVVVSITGNIGCGKTTTLQNLPATLHAFNESHKVLESIEVISEPVAEWESSLKRFYQEPSSDALLDLQYLIMGHYSKVSTHIQDMQEKCAQDGLKRLLVIERSPFDVLHVFLPANRSMLSDNNYLALETFCQHYARQPYWKNALILYLQASAEICYDRACHRKRNSEKTLSRDYMDTLDKLYQNFASHCGATSAGLEFCPSQMKVFVQNQDTSAIETSEWARTEIVSLLLRNGFAK